MGHGSKRDAASQAARYLSSGVARPSMGRIIADYTELSCERKPEAYIGIGIYSTGENKWN